MSKYRELIERISSAAEEDNRLFSELEARGLPPAEADIANARFEVLVNTLWGPFDPKEMESSSELRLLFELDYLNEMGSRMRAALLTAPPPGPPGGGLVLP